MKIAVLGLGVWGFCLARHLALLGHEVFGWTRDSQLLRSLASGEDHPNLQRSCRGLPLHLLSSLSEAIGCAELVVESVTTGGLRSVLARVRGMWPELAVPLVLTSKGIEQKSFLLPPDVVVDVFGSKALGKVAMLSGPSFAAEVSKGSPAAVVCGCTEPALSEAVSRAFCSNSFRVYPNLDIRGVALGGALKNVVAIACGIAEGLGLGTGARAALVTRGLHEMVKIAVAERCRAQTLYGLSGLGDLYLTCSSTMSRNFRFGQLISTGLARLEAEKQVGMIVEGVYTAMAASGLARKHGVPMPITDVVLEVVEGRLACEEAVDKLMLRHVKEEGL